MNYALSNPLYSHSNPYYWSTQDVCTWLNYKLGLSQYKKKFEELAIDGLVLYDIKDEDLLNDFDIKIRLHRLKILEGIKQLKAQHEEELITNELNESMSNLRNMNDITSHQITDTHEYSSSEKIHQISLNNTQQEGINNIRKSSGVIAQEYDLNKILVLAAIEGPLYNNIFILGVNGATLGRHSGSNDIVISESFVSRRHCEITHENDSFWIQDAGSTTGTFLIIKSAFELQVGQMFQMGLTEFRVTKMSLAGKTPLMHIEIFEGPCRSQSLVINHDGLAIGRDGKNDLAVLEDTQMSSFHAKITAHKKENTWTFRLNDLGSTNRTWLRLSPEGMKSEPHLLKYGDVVKVGSTVFITQKLDPEWLHKISQNDSENLVSLENKVPFEGLESLFEKKPKIKSDEKVNEKSDRDKDLCKICYLKNSEIAFVPCGHFAVCEDCAVKCDYCPFCKRTDIQIMRIFKS